MSAPRPRPPAPAVASLLRQLSTYEQMITEFELLATLLDLMPDGIEKEQLVHANKESMAVVKHLMKGLHEGIEFHHFL